MNKIKYISLKDLKKHLYEIIEEVYKYDTQYIVMLNNKPKVRLSSLDGENGKEMVVEEVGEIDKKKLKKFVE